MTQTIQPHSRVFINKNKMSDFQSGGFQPEGEDNVSLLFSVCDSLNNLNEKLNKLDYLLKRKLMEQRIYRNNAGKR
ncbi:MAG: hypothetical protein LBH20_03525 [Treponema sp.]|jgi:hypothetical protein|nr:hypothetical protein [Treponema sp.]